MTPKPDIKIALQTQSFEQAIRALKEIAAGSENARRKLDPVLPDLFNTLKYVKELEQAYDFMLKEKLELWRELNYEKMMRQVITERWGRDLNFINEFIKESDLLLTSECELNTQHTTPKTQQQAA